MPPLPPWPRNRRALYDLGVARAVGFCPANGVPPPEFHVIPKARWHFDACAFYRPDTPREREHLGRLAADGYGVGVNVCLEHCGRPCGDDDVRNWSWPGSVTDRTCYGVVCHELGHHLDWLADPGTGRYWSSWCNELVASGEPPLTGYAGENPAEFAAEALRLYVTNPGLLRALRPRTFAVIARKYRPVGNPGDWRVPLRDVPARVVLALRNKGAR